ncbi:MAG TPA: response regulator transcription factor, partial [Rhodothermales bacterium]|nr:response regulator transcription factor [Rhodothermales bacterium]
RRSGAFHDNKSPTGGVPADAHQGDTAMDITESSAAALASQQSEGSSEAYRMLIVEYDPQVSEALEEYFQSEDYDVTIAGDGAAALALMEDPGTFDIVLLDVMLPRKNGFEVLEESQRRGFHIPVLMMSGRGGQERILRGFGLGAEDYLVKPFDPDELMNRVRAILGRVPSADTGPPESYSKGSLVIDFIRETVARDGDEISLTELEFDVLRYLVRYRGRVVSRKRLLLDAWGIDEDIILLTISPEVVISKLEEHVESLQRKIRGSRADGSLIETVFGQGYRFNG